MPKIDDESRTELLAVAVAGGMRINAFAEKHGLNKKACYRLAEKPGFKTRVAQLRRQAVDRAVGKMSAAAASSAKTLISLLADRPEACVKRDNVKLAAAKAVLAALAEMEKHATLEDEYARLKAKFDARAGDINRG